MSRKLNFLTSQKAINVTKYEFYYVAETELCNVAEAEYFDVPKWEFYMSQKLNKQFVTNSEFYSTRHVMNRRKLRILFKQNIKDSEEKNKIVKGKLGKVFFTQKIKFFEYFCKGLNYKVGNSVTK